MDIVGVARPLCGDADVVGKLLRGELQALPAFEDVLKLGPGALQGVFRWVDNYRSSTSNKTAFLIRPRACICQPRCFG